MCVRCKEVRLYQGSGYAQTERQLHLVGYKTYNDLYKDGTTYSLSKKLVVNPGWYYYVKGVHYAKKNALSTQKITSETGVKKV